MRARLLRISIWGAACLAAIGLALASPETGPDPAGQAAADELLAATGTDAAWLPGGMLRPAPSPDAELTAILQFPTDKIGVVRLRGAQVREALERSLALYPATNSGFLQIAGMTVSFSRSAPAGSRVRDVTIAGQPLSTERTYDIAMPLSLARGGLGYFKVWERSQIVRTLPELTLERLLAGKSSRVAAPRWVELP